jgi:hypothetical protein
MALREDVPITDLLSAAEDVLRRLEDEEVADVAVVPVLRAVTVLRAATPTAVLEVVVREDVVVASTVVSSLSLVLFLSRSVEVAVRLVMLPNGARYTFHSLNVNEQVYQKCKAKPNSADGVPKSL